MSNTETVDAEKQIRHNNGLPLTNGRGRIRCISETGDWRDCTRWAEVSVYGWSSDDNDYRWKPFCYKHAWDIHGVRIF